MVFIGILLATVCNFTLGFLGYTIAINSVFLVNTFSLVGSEITSTEYIYSFFLKFLVVLVLTWILNKVMPLFWLSLFLLGS